MALRSNAVAARVVRAEVAMRRPRLISRLEEVERVGGPRAAGIEKSVFPISVVGLYVALNGVRSSDASASGDDDGL